MLHHHQLKWLLANAVNPRIGGTRLLVYRRINVFSSFNHDDVTTWKLFRLYWSYVRGIHRSLMVSSHKMSVIWIFDASALVIHKFKHCWTSRRFSVDLRRLNDVALEVFVCDNFWWDLCERNSKVFHKVGIFSAVWCNGYFQPMAIYYTIFFCVPCT